MNVCAVYQFVKDILMPVVVAIIAALMTELFARKRDFKQRKIEIQLEYLKKELDYLVVEEDDLLLLTRKMENCLAKDNPDDRWSEYNNIINQVSEFNEKAISTSYMLECFNDSMGIKAQIKKEETRKRMEDLTDLFIDYISKPDTSKATEEINTHCKSIL